MHQRKALTARRTRSNPESGPRIRTISGKVERSDLSKQIDETSTFSLTGENHAIDTPYPLINLHGVFEKSNILRQCVQAYVTNIVMNGYQVVPIEDGVVPDQGEVEQLNSFISMANTDESLVSVQSKHVYQYEKYGFSFLEVIRNARGKISLLRHVKAAKMRIVPANGRDRVTVTYFVTRGGRRDRITEQKSFRKFVQETNSRKVYFKEFGDPRRMDSTDGRYETDDKPVPEESLATEILHERQYSEDAYGLPRWIAQLPAILGSREAEEVNLRYFEDNTVPPMIMSIAGGRLTRQSYQDLTNILQSRGVGRERQHQIILIEAVPEVTDLDGKGTVTVKIDKLADARQSDSLFTQYDESNQTKVRSSFRLPPVFIGMSQDVTFATANVSAFLAEMQVFQPERGIHDEFLNTRVVNHPQGMALKTVKLRSRGPAITNPDEILRALTSLNVMGAVTPRSAIEAVNKSLRLGLPQYPVEGEEGWEAWMDQPMPLSIRQAGTQQTGGGDSTHDESAATPTGDKQQQAEGSLNPLPVEHGQE